jgi:hypothetical protein
MNCVDIEEQKICDDCLKKPCYSACALILGLRLHKTEEIIKGLIDFVALNKKTIQDMENEHTEMRLKLQKINKIIDEFLKKARDIQSTPRYNASYEDAFSHDQRAMAYDIAWDRGEVSGLLAITERLYEVLK